MHWRATLQEHKRKREKMSFILRRFVTSLSMWRVAESQPEKNAGRWAGHQHFFWPLNSMSCCLNTQRLQWACRRAGESWIIAKKHKNDKSRVGGHAGSMLSFPHELHIRRTIESTQGFSFNGPKSNKCECLQFLTCLSSCFSSMQLRGR